MSERAALIPSDPPKPSLWARIIAIGHAALAAQTNRWRLWAPVAFGAGCAVYFRLSSEPDLWPLVLIASVFSGLWLVARRRGAKRTITVPLMILACVGLGLSTAKIRAERVAGPIAPSLSEPTTITAWVLDVDSPGANGHRVLIAPAAIRG